VNQSDIKKGMVIMERFRESREGGGEMR